MASSEIRAGKAYVEIGTKNSGLDAGFLSARRHLGSFVDSVRGAELKLRNFSVSARNLGLDLIKLGVVLGTPVVFSVKQFADFEKQLARISTFLKNPQELMPKFKSEILKLSDEFGIAATEMANGLAEILSANIPASESFEFLKQAMKGAVGNAVEFKDQLSGLITFMQAFQGSGLTAARATELLRVAVEEGRIPANDLANTMGMVASKMAQAGGSAEELIATYSALSTTGLSVSEQTTMFRGILTAFSDASPETAKEFVRLSKAVTGIAQPMTLANLRTQGFTKTLEWLSKLSPDDLGKIFKDVRAANGIIVLSSKMDLYKRSLEAARGRANLADKAFETMSTTLTHLGEKIVTVGKNLAIQFGEVLLGTLKEVGNALIEIGNIVSAFVKANPQLAITLTKIAVTAATVGGVLLGLGLAFSIMSTALSGLVAIGGVVVGIISSIVGTISSLVLFLFSWGGAITAFGVALINTFFDFGKVFDSVKNGIKSGVDNLKGIFSKFKDSIGRTFDAVKNAVAAKNYDLAVKLVINKIKILWIDAVDEITKKYNQLKDSFVEKFNYVKQFLSDFVTGVLEKFTELTKLDIFSNLGEMFNDVLQDMDGSLLGFQKTWIRVWTNMQQFALSVLKTFKDTIDNLDFGMTFIAQKITGSRTEGEIADAQWMIKDLFKKDADTTEKIKKLEKLAQVITSQNITLEASVSTDFEKAQAKQNLVYLKRDFDKIFKEISDKVAFGLEMPIGKSQSDLKNALARGFNPLSPYELALNNILSQSEQSKVDRQSQFDKDIDEGLKKQESKIQALNEAALKDEDLAKIKKEELREERSKLIAEEQKLIKDASVALEGKKLADLVTDLNTKFGNFWEKTFAQDAKVPNDRTDISAIEIEKQKIKDGIMGAFNVNALGNFGAGDVMKSVKELLEEAQKKANEAKAQRDEQIKIQTMIQKNTKEIPRFTGG